MVGRDRRARRKLPSGRPGGLSLPNEGPQNKDDSFFRDRGKGGQAGGLHVVAKAKNRSAFAVDAEKQSGDDALAERKRERFWARWFTRRKRSALSGFSETAETVH